MATFSIAFVLLVSIALSQSTTVFLLVGDSTTATQSSGGGGWGDGFKNFTLNSPNVAYNYGHDGATTASYIASGEWATILNLTKAFVAKDSHVYVTIQFGHNDQKIANFSGQYKINLARMASDVKAEKGIPIIVSSLSRRNYVGNTSIIDDTLKPWAMMALEVANATDTHSINLWNSSLTYLEEIGQTAAYRLNLNPTDHTHLNVDGSIVFGRMVADLIDNDYSKEFEGIFKPNKTLSYQIAHGIPSF